MADKLSGGTTIGGYLAWHSGNMDPNAHTNLTADSVEFNSLYDVGTQTANFSIDVKDGQYQTVTLGASVTLSITAPSGPCTFYLHINQDATGGRVLTLPTGKWVDGIVKANTVSVGALDILMVHYYGGTSYVFEMMKDLS